MPAPRKPRKPFSKQRQNDRMLKLVEWLHTAAEQHHIPFRFLYVHVMVQGARKVGLRVPRALSDLPPLN